MPVITMEAAKLTKEQKRTLAKRVYRDSREGDRAARKGVFVFIKENELDNVGVGGQLISDRNKEV